MNNAVPIIINPTVIKFLKIVFYDLKLLTLIHCNYDISNILSELLISSLNKLDEYNDFIES